MKVLGSPVFALIFALVFMLFLFKYWNLLKTFSFRLRILLVLLRTITIISLLILLINPWINIKRHKKISQKVDVIFDNSESLQYHYNNKNISPNQIKENIASWAITNDVDVNFYRLGSKIEPLEKLDDYDSSTDFSQLPEFIEYKLPHQLLLITDGRATVGRELNDLSLPVNIPINVVGVGPLHVDDDLIIKRINVPNRIIHGDTVKIVVKLRAHLTRQVTTKLQIVNERDNYIYDRTILFDRGNHNKDIYIYIPAENCSGVNKAFLLPVDDELNIKNNENSFRVNIQKTEKYII